MSMEFKIFNTQGKEGTHYFRIDGYANAYISTYKILRKTLKGCWISVDYEQEKFILDDARKRWAYPTEELARNSYRIRKERQIRHCNDMIKAANEGLIKIGFKAIDPTSCFRESTAIEDYW